MFLLFAGSLFCCVCDENTQHEIYLNTFLSVQCGTVTDRRDVVQQMSRTYSFCVTETLDPLKSNSLIPPPLSPPQLPAYSLDELDYLRYPMSVCF